MRSSCCTRCLSSSPSAADRSSSGDRASRSLHLPAALWAAWVEFTGTICPLTPLENAWRARGGRSRLRTAASSSTTSFRCSIPTGSPRACSSRLGLGRGRGQRASVRFRVAARAMREWRNLKNARPTRIARQSGRPRRTARRIAMTLCPIAIAVGCKKCPVFSVCPAEEHHRRLQARRGQDGHAKSGKGKRRREIVEVIFDAAPQRASGDAARAEERRPRSRLEDGRNGTPRPRGQRR